MSDKRTNPGDTYRQEAVELLQRLETVLLELDDGAQDPELINEAFRALHTIKGSGAMFGFDDVVAFAHHFENAFDLIREGQVELQPPLIDCAFRAADHLAQLIDEQADPNDGQPILDKLTELLGAASNTPVPETEPASPEPEASAGTTQQQYRIVFYPEESAFRFGTNPLLMFDELRELGTLQVIALTDRVPPLESCDPSLCYLGWELTLTTSAPQSAIEDVFVFVSDDAELKISVNDQRAAAPTDEPPSESRRDSGSDRNRNNSNSPPAESVRVSAERLDSLMDQVGELVIAQSRLADMAERKSDPSLRAVAEDIERLVMNLRDETLGIRMVPIGVLFSKFRRVTRDLSKELEKSVAFETLGEETEVDKTFIEKLNDPLVHLIRNSMDHGLETPDQREDAGKPPEGRLRLSAQQEGGEVLITVADDGRGLDTDKIWARALERGLVTEEQELPPRMLKQLIFEPGFSTAAAVSNVSGRGVGMDAVKRTIEDLRGSIDLESEPGEGTAIRMRLPLTLAIIEGFHVNVGGGAFVLPLDVVEECVELTAADDRSCEGRSLIALRDQYVPFARLHDLFGFDLQELPNRRMVIIRVGEERVGLVVDEIIGQRQTVIKPLSILHRAIPGLSGATILGDGRVALIIDVAAIVAMARDASVMHPDGTGRPVRDAGAAR